MLVQNGTPSPNGCGEAPLECAAGSCLVSTAVGRRFRGSRGCMCLNTELPGLLSPPLCPPFLLKPTLPHTAALLVA